MESYPTFIQMWFYDFFRRLSFLKNNIHPIFFFRWLYLIQIDMKMPPEQRKMQNMTGGQKKNMYKFKAIIFRILLHAGLWILYMVYTARCVFSMLIVLLQGGGRGSTCFRCNFQQRSVRRPNCSLHLMTIVRFSTTTNIQCFLAQCINFVQKYIEGE